MESNPEPPVVPKPRYVQNIDDLDRITITRDGVFVSTVDGMVLPPKLNRHERRKRAALGLGGLP